MDIEKKARVEAGFCAWIGSGPWRIRTSNLVLKSPYVEGIVLYGWQLRLGGVVVEWVASPGIYTRTSVSVLGCAEVVGELPLTIHHCAGIYTCTMTALSRRQRQRPWVDKVGELLGSQHTRAFSRSHLRSLLEAYGDKIGIPKSASVSKVVSLLESSGRLQRVELRREGKRSRGALTRYIWDSAAPESIGVSLRSASYVSHSSAMFLHGLTDQVPKTIYVNKEQTPKGSARRGLTQAAIDRAFSGRPRRSLYAYTAEKHRYVLLSGKSTGRLGVTEVALPSGERVAATDLERTLIDIVVRPAYGGGPDELVRAYEGAKERVSGKKLVATLGKLDYVYPYHQCIGFLMEKADYAPATVKLLSKREIIWNFYLDYGMSDMAYSERWRLFYPQGL